MTKKVYGWATIKDMGRGMIEREHPCVSATIAEVKKALIANYVVDEVCGEHLSRQAVAGLRKRDFAAGEIVKADNFGVRLWYGRVDV